MMNHRHIRYLVTNVSHCQPLGHLLAAGAADSQKARNLLWFLFREVGHRTELR